MHSPRFNMTIRKRILLYSALALGAFLAVVYFVSRFALLNGFSRLERNYAYGSVRRIQNHLENCEDLRLKSRWTAYLHYFGLTWISRSYTLRVGDLDSGPFAIGDQSTRS